MNERVIRELTASILLYVQRAYWNDGFFNLDFMMEEYKKILDMISPKLTIDLIRGDKNDR